MNPYVSRARRCLLTAAASLLLTGCSGLFSPSDQGDTSSNSTAPVDLITNGTSKASHTTHWFVNFYASSTTGDWAFFADGTGAFRVRGPGSACANQGIGDFTWTRLGSDALLVNLALDPLCGPTFTNFANIIGSISTGQFTTALDGNPYPRPFFIQSGALP